MGGPELVVIVVAVFVAWRLFFGRRPEPRYPRASLFGWRLLVAGTLVALVLAVVADIDPSAEPATPTTVPATPAVQP